MRWVGKNLTFTFFSQRARLATGVVFLYVRGSPEGSPPCRGRRAWVPWRPLKLCQRELRLLVGPPKPDRLKARGPTKRDPSVLQFRGLGTGITTLSRKTPMLRKRQKKAEARGKVIIICEYYVPKAPFMMDMLCKWIRIGASLFKSQTRSSLKLTYIKEGWFLENPVSSSYILNPKCTSMKLCVPRFSVTVGLKRLMKSYGVKPN